MTQASFIRARSKAAAKIQQYGGPIAVLRTSGVVDPVEGTVGEPVQVMTGHALQTNYTKTATDGERVKPGDKKFLVVVNGRLQDEDQIVMGGVTWYIKDIKDIQPDGDYLIMSTVQVRR